jgi:hypothetical protein
MATNNFHIILTKYAVATISLFLFLGCECFPVEKGIVVDESNSPIKNAQVEFGNQKSLTDSIGRFEIAASGCNLKLIISKESYKSFIAKTSAKNSKINIELEDSKDYKDLNQPKYLNSDSSSYIVSKAHDKNSVHFEYIKYDSLKIYLTKIEK